MLIGSGINKKLQSVIAPTCVVPLCCYGNKGTDVDFEKRNKLLRDEGYWSNQFLLSDGGVKIVYRTKEVFVPKELKVFSFSVTQITSVGGSRSSSFVKMMNRQSIDEAVVVGRSNGMCKDLDVTLFGF